MALMKEIAYEIAEGNIQTRQTDGVTQYGVDTLWSDNPVTAYSNLLMKRDAEQGDFDVNIVPDENGMWP